MKKTTRIWSFCVALLMMVTPLTGCNKATTEGTEVSADVANADVDPNTIKAKDMEALDALTFEEIAAQQTLSADDKENMVYQYVSDTVIVDTNKLVSVTEQETEALNTVVENVNTALCTGDTTYISSDMLNYMLWEMANTPYAWEYDSMEIKGIDAATRLYFVDVKYKTAKGTLKTKIPDSVIVRGSDDEESLKAKRYSDYMVWLESLEAMGTETYTKWQKLIDSERVSADAMSVFAYGLQYDSVMDGYTADAENKEDVVTSDTFIDAEGNERAWSEYTFEDRWGSLDNIFATQDGITLVDRLRDYNYMLEYEKTQVDETETSESAVEDTSETDVAENIVETETSDTETQKMGVYTYGGLTEVAQDFGAEMTFRMVFKYTYSISTDNAMKIQSLYLYDYTLEDSDYLVNSYTTETVQNSEALTPFIEKTIKSYRKALEESNHVGLYNLFVTYDKYDTYFADLLNYAYINNGGFTITPVGRKGDEVALVVTQRTQKRAKGTYMSMPTYQEEVLMKVKLCTDDTVRIVSTTTLKTILIGEPLSIIRDVNGVSEQIAYDASAFTKSNEVAVEQAVGAFEAIQVQYNGTDLSASVYDTIDLGMSSTEKTNMLNAFKAVNQLGTNKVAVWLTNYETKSNLYVSVKLREVFFGTSSNLDSEATLGLINRNGEWKVISYTRTLAVPTSMDANTETFKDTCLAIVDTTTNPVIQYYNATDSTNVTGDNGIDLSTDDDSQWELETEENNDETAVEAVTESGTENVSDSVQENENTSESTSDDVLGGLF